MTNISTLNEAQALPAEVSSAAQAFAKALAASPQFRDFEQAWEQLNQDGPAQQAIAAFQQKQRALQVLARLNAVSPEEQAELERLHQVFISHSTVTTYLAAQEALMAVCQASAGILTKRIGLSFTTSCGGSGCC